MWLPQTITSQCWALSVGDGGEPMVWATPRRFLGNPGEMPSDHPPPQHWATSRPPTLYSSWLLSEVATPMSAHLPDKTFTVVSLSWATSMGARITQTHQQNSYSTFFWSLAQQRMAANHGPVFTTHHKNLSHINRDLLCYFKLGPHNYASQSIRHFKGVSGLISKYFSSVCSRITGLCLASHLATLLFVCTCKITTVMF